MEGNAKIKMQNVKLGVLSLLSVLVVATAGFGKITKVDPDMRKAILDTLKVDGSEIAVITTKYGPIYMKFWPEDAPNTVKNFIMLANLGFYDGLTFHRVVPKFVVQGGDPLGDGTGGPGYNINAEFNKRKHLLGTVAMARSADPNSAGSQFYICLAPQPHLDGNYTVFGQVIKGMDVVKKIKQSDVMESVRIERKRWRELHSLCRGTRESVIYEPPLIKIIPMLTGEKEGKIVLSVVVSENKEILDVKIIESEVPELNEEAIESAKSLLVASPAKVNETPIKDLIVLTIEVKQK